MNPNINMPLVSVVLPVYNGALYLNEAIESVLKQTYTHFEFIILNDGSKDNSEEIILSYNDDRIKYHKHNNVGLASTLNIGLKLAMGKYIARQDQDDISHKTRFEKQVDFLENNPSIILLGTRANIFSSDASHNSVHKHAVQPAVLKFDLLFDNPFVHSSVMFKSNQINTIGFYNTDKTIYEDFEYWSRFSAIGSVANLPDILLEYRHHDLGLSKSDTFFTDGALAENALMNLVKQSKLNIELLLGKQNDSISDLTLLYHWQNKKCKGVLIKQLFEVLKEIAIKIIELNPSEKKIVLDRLNQYKKMIRYRINKNSREISKNNIFKLFLLKVENKVFKLHSNLIND